MDYYTIKKESSAQYEEKKSIFIATTKCINTEENAKDFINTIKTRNKEARHNVYAYAIGSNMDIQRMSDDGEPQGTGGMPVLQVIKKSQLTDVIIVVTRYFGGILLGSAGLCRAYGKAASEAIKNAQIVEKILGCKLIITIDYEFLGKIQFLFHQNNWQINKVDYTDKIKLHTICQLYEIQVIEIAIINLTSNKCFFQKMDERYYFKENNTFFEVLN